MPTIKTVKPAGGGDYTTLAAWETFAGGQATADQWAECYSGSLGAVVLAGWTATPDAATYPKIYAATGHQHDCMSATSGAYCGGYIWTEINYTRIENMSCNGTGGVSAIYLPSSVTGWVVSGCLLVQATNGSTWPVVYSLAPGAGAAITGTIRNNILRLTGTGTQTTMLLSVLGTGATGDFAIHNNTGYAITGHIGFYLQCVTNDAVAASLKNNVVAVVSGAAFTDTPGVTFAVTAANNASTDATADDYGGSGHLINQTATDLFTDPAGNDFSLKAGSSLINAGTDLSGSFTTDIIGNTRPTGAAFDIGAFEYQAPKEINVTGNGQSIADGDSTPSSADHTDFGSVVVGGSAPQKTFTVENLGDLVITISSVTVPTGYEIDAASQIPGAGTTISGGASKTLVVNLLTVSAGTKSGDVTINSDDADEGAYNFAVSGVCLPVNNSPPSEPDIFRRSASSESTLRRTASTEATYRRTPLSNDTLRRLP